MRSWVAVPLGLGWALGRVDRLRIRRTSPLFFPLQTIAPSLRGLPAPAGWGSHNPRAAFLYAPVLVIIWGDFGILECPHGPFRRNAARRFPVCTSTGNHLGRFWNIGISARTLQEKCGVFFPVYTSAGKCLGRFWNIGMSARTFQEKYGTRFSCIHQYWQFSGEILEYRNIRTDLSGKRACAQYAKMEALFCAVCPDT